MEQEIIRILQKFAEYLEITNPISYMLRTVGWMIVKGLAWIVDSLENVTDSILLLKTFYNDTDVEALVKMLLPLTGTLMGLSFLYTGYLIIFQKKVDREAIAMNMFLAFAVLALIGEGMDKANKFTDVAIDSIEDQNNGSTAEKIVKDNVTDVAQFDLTEWKTTDLKNPNQIPTSSILKIDITQSIDKDFKFADEKRKMTPEGKEVLSNKLQYDDAGNPKSSKLEAGWLKIDEKYYQYNVDWFTVMITLAITAFTLLTIAIKLAKLFFELTFNYVLATIIAPADIHSGQKTKQVIQSILNIFLVTIMVFLSMKIYILGTDFIDAKLDGVAYLIALFAFSLAVIDGPNIVERLFGIDAGLKSSYGALAGAYTGAKGASQGLKGLSSAGKSSALKGIQGVAGVAGMAQGLRSRGQEQSQDQQKEQAQNALQNGKNNGNSKTQENDLRDNQIENGANENGNTPSEEIATGMQEVASSLVQEMEQKQQQDKGINGNKPQGLHQEMSSKGFSSNGKQSAAVKSSHSISSGSPPQMDNDDLQKNEKMFDESGPSISSSPSFSQSNYPSVLSEMQAESNNLVPLEEKRTDRETRHLGQVVSDKVRNNPSIKTVKRTYQIGENTGEALRKNIANYRKNHGKE